MIEFKSPWILIAIPVVVFFLLWQRRKKGEASLKFSSKKILAQLGSTWRTRFIKLPFFLRLLVMILLFIALAGPRSVLEETKYKTEGIDIVLALDTSGSMAAEDFKINGERKSRLEVIKNVVEEFIKARGNDRLGLVAFSALAYTVCPLTTDYDWLIANLERIRFGLIKDGTAIGSAISSAVNRLKKSQAKSKVIVLLTDGINNAGKVDPLTAAKAAKALRIKVYTIGAGTKGYAPFPVEDVFGRRVYQQALVEIDEKTLKEIAELTGGKYFRATDTESLRQVYQEIDKLEKTEIQQLGYKEYKEQFYVFLTLALILLGVEQILSRSILLKIP